MPLTPPLFHVKKKRTKKWAIKKFDLILPSINLSKVKMKRHFATQGAVVVAQLAEWSLTKSEIPGLNPIILYRIFIYR